MVHVNSLSYKGAIEHIASCIDEINVMSTCHDHHILSYAFSFKQRQIAWSLNIVGLRCSGHVCMADGRLEACALKKLDYTFAEKDDVHTELNALHMALGKPHVVQGLAAFRWFCAETHETYVWIAMRYVMPHCTPCTQV